MIEYGVALDKVTIINLAPSSFSKTNQIRFSLIQSLLDPSPSLLLLFNGFSLPPLFSFVSFPLSRRLPSPSLPFAFRVSWSNAFPANSCRAARFIDLLLLDNGDSCRYLLEMKVSFLSIRRICVEHLGIFTETGRSMARGFVFTIGLKPALRKIVSRLFLIFFLYYYCVNTQLYNYRSIF